MQFTTVRERNLSRAIESILFYRGLSMSNIVSSFNAPSPFSICASFLALESNARKGDVLYRPRHRTALFHHQHHHDGTTATS